MMRSKREIMGAIKSIPAMPSAAAKVMELYQNPEVQVDELKRAIEFDPGLTSNVLRLANSAYFAGPRTVGTVKEAIVRLGLTRVFQLTVAAAVSPVAWHEVQGYGLKPGQLLEHSISVAIGAEQIAEALSKRAPFHAFTAGILHDVGKVVLGTFLAIDCAPIMKLAFEEGIPFDQAEQQVLGLDHAEVGAMLLESWNLPSPVVEAVRFHHRPEQIPADSFATDLVHVADHLSMEIALGTGVDELNYKPSQEVMNRIRLTPTGAESVLCKMLSGVEELYQLLGGNDRR